MSTAVIQRIKTATAARNLALQSQTLYNASDERVTFSVGVGGGGAIPFVLPPDGVDVTDDGAQVRCSGELKVYDIYGKNPEQLRIAKKEKRDVSALPNNVLQVTALAIVEHALKKLERRGVTVLSGDPTEDALLKADARKQWILFRKVSAETTIKRYRERTEGFTRDPRNAGMAPPAMEEHEAKAQLWLDQYRLGLTGHKKLVCAYRDGFQTEDAALMDIHMRASHPFAEETQRTVKALAEVRGSETPEDDEPEVVTGTVAPKRRGRPPKVQPAA